MRGEQVLALEIDAGESGGLLLAPELRMHFRREPEEEVEMARAHGVRLVRRGELLLCVLTHRLEHPVARRFGVDLDERFVDQGGHEVEHVVRGDRAAGGHRFGRVEREAAGECCQPREHGLLGGIEQVVAPVDQRAQRLLSRQARPGAAREELEAVVQTLGDRFDRQRAHASGGELQRERNAVEAPADLDQRVRVLRGHGEPRLHGLGAIDEQPHGLELQQGVGGQGRARVGNGQRLDRVRDLAGHVEVLAARREQPDPGARLEKLFGQVGARVHEVLAVVEDDEELAVANELDERLDHGAARLLHDAEHGRDRLGNQPCIGDRRKLDEPDAVGKFVEHVGRDLQRQPRLAETAHPEQREQRRFLEQLSHLGLTALAADERRHLLRQVVRRRLERAEGREVLAQLGMHRLVDVLRAREVAQPHTAQVAQRDPCRQLLPDRLHGSLREQDLATVGSPHDACGAVDGAAEVVVVAMLGRARVHAAAYGQRDPAGGRGIGERELEIKGRA